MTLTERAQQKVYVLDDDPVVLERLRDALAGLGEVHTSALWSDLAPSLLRAGASGQRVVLVCDLDMPGISGVDFCNIVRRHCPDVGLIIFTSEPTRTPGGVADLVIAKQEGAGALRGAVQRLLQG
ncbi:MAG: response regulator [Planctomycetota bacterium]